MKKLLLVLLSLAMLFACDLGSDSDSKKEDEKKATEPEVVTPEETTVTTGRTIVEDSNGNKVGEVIGNHDGMQILTPKGYLINMSFGGNYYCGSPSYSSELNGSGDLYVGYNSDNYYKGIYERNGVYYELADRDAKGNPIPDTTVAIKCEIKWDGTIVNNPIDNNGKFYKLVPRTMAELGLVENISLPIKLVSGIK